MSGRVHLASPTCWGKWPDGAFAGGSMGVRILQAHARPTHTPIDLPAFGCQATSPMNGGSEEAP